MEFLRKKEKRYNQLKAIQLEMTITVGVLCDLYQKAFDSLIAIEEKKNSSRVQC